MHVRDVGEDVGVWLWPEMALQPLLRRMHRKCLQAKFLITPTFTTAKSGVVLATAQEPRRRRYPMFPTSSRQPIAFHPERGRAVIILGCLSPIAITQAITTVSAERTVHTQ